MPLPLLAGDVKADVCVVGLGGSGLACVEELLKLGARVVGLDAGSVAGGAAGRNGGFLLGGLAHFHHHAARALGRERAKALYRATLGELDHMVAAMPDLVRRPGSLRIVADEREARDACEQLSAMRADDLAVEPYEGAEGRGLLFPDDAVCNPLARCRELARRCVAGGARLFEHTPALEITIGAVKTPGGCVRCRAICILIDGGMERVLPEVRERVRTARLQMLATAPETAVRFPRPVYYRYGYEYWQQLPDGRIALGGFRDRFESEEWTHQNQPTAALQSALEDFLRDRLNIGAAVTHRWAANVGYTPDVLPWIGEARRGVWAAGGYSGTGNIVGALCGRALARRIARGDDELLRLLAGH